MNKVAKKVIGIAEWELGGIGPSFLQKQMERMGRDTDSLTLEDLPALAVEASKNCLLLVGKVRAENLRSAIITYGEMQAEEGGA